jgi:hypothetical protein
MSCGEWSRILCWYCKADRIYSDATDALGLREDSGFTTTWEVLVEARKACARFRAALLEHEHKHGGQVAPAQSIRPRGSEPFSGSSIGQGLEITQYARDRA